MISPLFGGDNSAPSTSGINFNFINAQSLSAYSSTENTRDITVTSAMTLSNLYAAVDIAPGGAASYTFAVYKNGSVTTLSAVISGSNTSATDGVNSVSFVAGDTISMSVNPAGTPAAVTFTMWNIQCSASGQPILGGHSSSASSTSTNYLVISSSATNTGIYFAAESNATVIMPTSGTFSNLGLTLSSTPGVGKNYALALVVNGTDSSLVATVADTNTTATDTTHSVSVSAGDTVSLKLQPTGTPTARVPVWGMLFTPTTDGESFFGYGGDANPSTSTTNFEQPYGVGANNWNGSEPLRNNLILGAYTLKKLYVKVGTAPGAGKSYVYSLRRNAASTGLTVTIADAATTGNIATDVSLSQGDKLAISAAPSGTPAVPGGEHFGILIGAPAGPGGAANSGFFLLMS